MMSLKILEREYDYTKYKGIKCFWTQYHWRKKYTYIEFIGGTRYRVNVKCSPYGYGYYYCSINLNNVIIHLHNTVIPKIQHQTKMKKVFDVIRALPGGIDYQNAAQRFKETSYAIYY